MKQKVIRFLLILFLALVITVENSAQEHLSSRGFLSNIHEAVCYSGFRLNQHPDRGNGAKNPSDSEILQDLQIITFQTPFKMIRLYDCGENSRRVLRLIDKYQFDIKVVLGIWLNAEVSTHETCAWLNEPFTEEELRANRKANQRSIEEGIVLAQKYSNLIVAVSVGNESLVDWNDHKITTRAMIEYVKQVKREIPQLVTVADNYAWWANHGEELSEYVDFVSIHIYPIWEEKNIDEALNYSKENVQLVRDALPHSRIVITEAGWPTTATEFGHRATYENQATYYNQLMKWTKEEQITLFFFEAFDEYWKGNPDNPNGAEKHWGLFFIDRTPKMVMKNFIRESKE